MQPPAFNPLQITITFTRFGIRALAREVAGLAGLLVLQASLYYLTALGAARLL